MRHIEWVHFGCGLCAPDDWSNYDSSPTLRLEKLPLAGALVPAGPYGRFPANVLYGDIVKGLPVAAGSVDLLYCSHVLEHLSLADLRTALRNCRDKLREGGVFRLVLPDVEFIIDEYRNDPTENAAVHFMENTLLGQKSRDRTFRGLLRSWLGNSHHLWMWDYKGLAAELRNAGFRNVRRASYNDSLHDAFRLVETADRWERQLGIECS
jgi:SAM-dependent methyltransferase